jgi:hypothetical protein
MQEHEVALVKEYNNRTDDRIKELRGVMKVVANNQKEAEDKVEAMMGNIENTLQTIDPRIEWEEDFEEGCHDNVEWDYVDGSFNVERQEASVSDTLETIKLRCNYILNSCRTVAEMELEAKAILRKIEEYGKK